MEFNQRYFKRFSNTQVIECIRYINQQLNENIPINDAGDNLIAKSINITSLVRYLNQHNAYNQIFGNKDIDYISVDDVKRYVQRVNQQHDKEFFDNFDKNQYKSNEPLDEFQRKIEEQINIAKQAMNNAISLI